MNLPTKYLAALDLAERALSDAWVAIRAAEAEAPSGTARSGILDLMVDVDGALESVRYAKNPDV